MDVVGYNREAWDRQSRRGSEWARPVDAETIARARDGDLDLLLTPTVPVPSDWIGEVRDRDLLCLASGGGQQAPVLAAAGARVTSFDLSDEQLAKDLAVAEREGLELTCVQGDMADLSAFADSVFDLVFHPVANVFVPDLAPVWRGCRRILREGGVLLTGFMTPHFYLFDHDAIDDGHEPRLRYRLPYGEPADLDEAGRARLRQEGRACEFSHTLDAQIGGQLRAGFSITGFYEDPWTTESTPLADHFHPTFATRAVAT